MLRLLFTRFLAAALCLGATIAAPAASTVTTSLNTLGVTLALTVVVLATATSTLLKTAVVKPLAETRTSYVPARALGRRPASPPEW